MWGSCMTTRLVGGLTLPPLRELGPCGAGAPAATAAALGGLILGTVPPATGKLLTLLAVTAT